MITAIIGPADFNSLNILEQKLSVKEVGVIVFANTSKWWSQFSETVIMYCNRNCISFMCFHTHWENGDQADKAAIANIITVGNRLIAFMQSGDMTVVKTIAEFKKLGKEVQIIRIGEKT